MISGRQTEIANWKQFETYVYSLYCAFGYSVNRNVAIGGNQIDLLCEKHIDGFNRVRIVVECKHHNNKRSVGIDDVNKFLTLATNLIVRGEASGGAMITNTEFSKEARTATLKYPLIALKTVSELESELFDFSHLYSAAVFDYEREEIFQTYVSMSAQIKTLSLEPKGEARLIDETLLRRISNEKPNLSIIFADFGGGKSTLLKDLFYRMAKAALIEPNARRPVLIELKNFHLYNSLQDFFYSALPGDLPRSMSQSRFNFLKDSGRFAFFLDGFDELRLPDFELDRARTFLEIRDFIGDKSSIVISCRPTYFATEGELKTVLRSFIEPGQQLLTRLYGRSNPRRDQANQLLENIGKRAQLPLKHGDLKIYFLDTLDEKQIKTFIAKFIKRTDAKLKQNVATIYRYLVGVYDISDLIKRPLLLYIIMYMIEHDIIDVNNAKPLGGAAEIYTLYIESCTAREYDKGVARSVFSKEERRRICQYLALLMVRSNSLRISWSEMLGYIIKEASSDLLLAKKMGALPVEEMSADIRVCSFLKFDEQDVLRFAHKSFMEFFVAQYLYERMQDFREKVISLELLRSPLSKEILFFLSEFVKLNSVFGDRLCNDRLLHTTKPPTHINQEQLNIIRRNLFAVNLISNFEKRALSLSKLIVGSLGFADAEVNSLSLKDGEFFDLSMTRFRVNSAEFQGCKIERVEFSDWIAVELKLSCPRLDLRLLGADIGTLVVFGGSGALNLQASKIARLDLKQDNKTKLLIKSSTLGVINFDAPNEIVDFLSCEIESLRTLNVDNWHGLIQTAQRLVFRNCTGPILNTLHLGKIDKEFFDGLKQFSTQDRLGLFFLDADLWQQIYPNEANGVAISRGFVFVRAGSASELMRILEGEDGQIKERLVSRLQPLLHLVSGTSDGKLH